MTRIDKVFRRLKEKGEKALIPFITAGDPDYETSRRLAIEIAARGADLLELGIPFSDPLADGPTIQASSSRALKNGVHFASVLALAGDLRRETDIPLILMGYYNPILQYGLEKAARDAAQQGIDGFIIPDLPLEEAASWRAATGAAGVSVIFLAAPTTGPERLKTLGRLTQGFLYYVSVTGITGARMELTRELIPELLRVRALVNCPIAVGFGISTPEQVKKLAPYVDGVVVGSAIVQQVAQFSGAKTIKHIGDFVASLKTPLRGGKDA
ncbi:MAG: tryptophan synthase subunit alpha [candidate division Zixibacteria bacterium RBG_16_53_22]|nr:MAG: tryptophan synthase subunit alpha [candidate division Zixibacteria bacterium RBG_16_53_22]